MTQALTSNEPAKESAPAPTFDALPLGPDVRKAIDELGYVNPTPVQVAVYEPATRGRNLVVQARTGTGKTAAFGLPIIDALVKKNTAAVQALILTPTRELALQVASELEEIAKFRGTKIIAIYGGAPMGKQVTALQEGAQVVCGTPGRVLDHIRRGTLDTSNIRIFVLDEADEMLSMGFAKELNAIIETLPKERQGLYFSATIPPDVERLANNHLREPEYITLSSDQVGALEINHYVYLVREGAKREALARIIEVEDPESAIVFCNTKDETERVAEMLKQRGYDADWLNGDLEQRERERVMAATREGKVRFLVCTDVAARGIDISHLTHVINADFPESAEHYVHRTGRTGRAGRTGTAISVVGPKDVGFLYMLRLTYKIRPIERTLPTKGELKTRAEADVVAFLADAYLGRAADPMHIAVARRLLTHENVEHIVAGLLADHLGASKKEDPVQSAAEARRAKNPPPVPAAPPPAVDRPSRSGEPPRTLREGESQREVPAGGRPRRERRPVSALADWEPPPERDDDKPLFDSGTKPGIGPADKAVAPLPPREAREPRRGRDRRRDEDSIDTGRPRTPGYTIEDAPTQIDRGSGDRGSGDRPGGGRERERERAPRERGGEDEGVQEGFANLFLNVGRRDGLKASDIHRMLVETVGLDEAEVGHIRVRDRITFVGVKLEQADRAISALVGQTVGDRTVNAERARPKA